MIELFKNIRKTYAYNVFSWLILFDIGIFLYLMPKPLKPLVGCDWDIPIILFAHFGLIYALAKILIPLIILFIEKSYLRPIKNEVIISNKLYLFFTALSAIIQLLIIIPTLMFFAYVFITDIVRNI